MAKAELPPGPTYPGIIQGFKLGLGIYDYLYECYEKYGDAVTIRVPGMTPMVWVNERNMVRDFFRLKSDQIDQKTLPVPLDIGNNAIGFSNGDEHRHSRKVLIPPLAGKNIENRLGPMHELITKRLDELQPGKEYDIAELIAEITLDIVAFTLLQEIDGVKFERYRYLLLGWLESSTTDPMFAIATTYGPSKWRTVLNDKYLKARDLGKVPLFDKVMPWGQAVQFKLDLAEEVRQDVRAIRAKPDADHKGVLAAIALSRYEDGELLSEEKVITEVISIFVGGHDTSAATGAWYMMWMMKKPEILAKMKQTVLDSIQKHGKFDPIKIVNDPFLDACLNESQRLTPSAVGTMRHNVEDEHIGSLYLPKHTSILAANFITHRRKDIWGEDALEYRPERWIGKDGIKPKPYEFYPFGGGHRACIGLNQAKQQLRLLFAEFARRCDFTSDTIDRDYWPGQRQINVQTHPAGGIKVRVDAIRPSTYGYPAKPVQEPEEELAAV
ncbi:MAG: cytochrome P450 [Pseudomonadales bacterium]|nr:cytochrome P450 [Pseudomonadales bacterium]